MRSMFVALALGFTGLAFANDDSVAWEDEPSISAEELSRGGSSSADAKKKKAAPTDDDEIELEDEDLEEVLEDEELEDEPTLGDFEGDLLDGPGATLGGSPGPISLAVAGKMPLADNYPLEVVAVDRDAVVIELPVLIASSRSSVAAGFQLIGEVWVGGAKVSEVRQVVLPASLAEFGPSFAFLKVSAPVVEKAGEIKVIVKQSSIDGTGATELFSRTSPYRLR